MRRPTHDDERERPLGGGMYWHEALRVFECLGCEERVEVKRYIYRDPERLAEHRELLEIEHDECWKYASAELAWNARRWRKEGRRRKMLVAAAARRLGLGR